mgnify:FL=1|tara:strand:- start:18 stop:1484 length:1467 start_codon:yes stop_codon:yes gene_type:complete
MIPILSGNVASALPSGYDVANSCRFDDGSSAYLYKADPGASGNRKTWTLSLWFKRGNLGTVQTLFSSGAGGHVYEGFVRINASDRLEFKNDGQYGGEASPTRVLRDVGSWYHLCWSVDATQGSNDNRWKIYLNGTLIPASEYSSVTIANADGNILDFATNASDLAIGRNERNDNGYWDGYIAEVVFIDGTQEAVTSFGEFDDDSPTIWKPKDVSGLSLGTNGFYLDFEDSSDLGADAKGSFDFTANNLAAIDSSTDTPTNNAVTFMTNHPSASNFTISEGNLKIEKSGSATLGLYGSSIMLSSGKWYWEVKMTADAGSDRTRVGLAAYESVTGTSTIQGSYSGLEFTCSTGGRFNIVTSGSNNEIDGFNSYSTGDIIRFALDMDNQRLYIGRNADWFNYSSSNTGGDPSSGSGFVTDSSTVLAAPVTIYAGHSVGGGGGSMELQFNFGATNTFSVSSGNSDANGYGNFEYSVPSGYYAINTKNLAEYG